MSSNKWITIDEEGNMGNKYLFISEDKRKREDRIIKNFQIFYLKTYNIKLPTICTQRDNPHDFTFVEGGITLRVEIVSISDSSSGFLKQSSRDYLEKKLIDKDYSVVAIVSPDTTKSILEKSLLSVEGYPSVELNIQELLNKYHSGERPLIRKVEGIRTKLLYITSGVNDVFENIIYNAVSGKESKRYESIEEMVLIVDDQTISYNLSSGRQGYFKLINLLKKSRFKEIFLYSEKFNNEESGENSFAFYPLKCFLDKNLNPRI